ncbi:MAG: DinB family protein [Candidatus Promineifilaceae bacterium]
MKRDDIEDKLDEVRERLLMALEPLPDEILVQKGLVGEWAISDVLANLAVWEAELVTGLMYLREGQRPQHLLKALADPDTYNRARYEEFKERDLDQIFDDLQGVRVQLEGWLTEFTDRELNDDKRFPTLAGKPLWQVIQQCSFGREAQRLLLIERVAAAYRDEEE